MNHAIKHKCECGKIYKVKPWNALKSKNCQSCGMKKFNDLQREKGKISHLRMLTKKYKGKIILTSEYLGSQKKNEYKCLTCNHKWLALPTDLSRYKNNLCPNCSGRKFKNWNNKTYREFTKQEGLPLPKQAFLGLNTAITHRCLCGNEWKVKPSLMVYYKKKTCPSCCGTCSSAISRKWLALESKRRRIKIQSAYNGGELYIPELKIRVDGYNKRTNTIFEFYGDVFHGNPDVYYPRDKPHPFSDKTAYQLHKETKLREKKIKKAGYNLVTIWENTFKREYVSR